MSVEKKEQGGVGAKKSGVLATSHSEKLRSYNFSSDDLRRGEAKSVSGTGENARLDELTPIPIEAATT